MKTFSVAVALAVVLAFICIQESSADPITGVQEPEEPEEPMSNDNPAAEHQELPGRLEKMLSDIRQKRQTNCCPYTTHGGHECILCGGSHGHDPILKAPE
ncbi:hepcidin-like [Centropristis striata]|uniref:hepcidin-like n=1 Tax=Centropristis striata TaxID=184440 RepID=UPI0027DEB5C9|nr:hepcidin-like [Centropristis striata]